MVKPGIYEHYQRGGRYRVIGIGLLEDTEQQVVIYEALYENDKSKFWVRPIESFEEIITVDGKDVPRFRFISEHEA